MPFDRLIPIERLRSDSLSSAAAGSLLVPYGTGRSLHLRFDSDSTKLALSLEAKKPRPFVGVNVENRHEPALILEDWTLRVDPATACNAFDGSPEVGDVLITTAGTGILARLDHATVFVTTSGQLLAEPAWGADQVVSFRGWSVGYQEGDRWIDLLPAHEAAG